MGEDGQQRGNNLRREKFEDRDHAPRRSEYTKQGGAAGLLDIVESRLVRFDPESKVKWLSPVVWCSPATGTGVKKM